MQLNGSLGRKILYSISSYATTQKLTVESAVKEIHKCMHMCVQIVGIYCWKARIIFLVYI